MTKTVEKIIDTKEQERAVKLKMIVVRSQIEDCPFIYPYRTLVQIKEAEPLPVAVWMCLGALDHNSPLRYCKPNCPYYHTAFLRSKEEESDDDNTT